jgi:hypothetical protein
MREVLQGMDYLLTFLVGSIQLLLGLLGVFVSMRPQPRERHLLLIVGFVVFALAGIGLNIYQQARSTSQSARDRQQTISETSASVSTSVSKNLKEEYRQTINDLQGQVENLQSQLEGQGKKVDQIGNSDIVTGKSPIKVEITNGGNGADGSGQPPLQILASELPVEPNPEYGKAAREIILTTNRVMDGAHASVHCLSKINNGMADIAGASAQSGGSGMAGDNTFNVDIDSPNWSPARPLVVTIYYDGPDWRGCNVALRQ